MRAFTRRITPWMIFGALALVVAVIVISQVTYSRPFAVEFGNYQRGKLTWLRIDLSLGILQLETPEFGITISRDEALFLALLFPAFVLFRKAVMPPKHPRLFTGMIAEGRGSIECTAEPAVASIASQSAFICVHPRLI